MEKDFKDDVQRGYIAPKSPSKPEGGYIAPPPPPIRQETPQYSPPPAKK